MLSSDLLAIVGGGAFDLAARPPGGYVKPDLTRAIWPYAANEGSGVKALIARSAGAALAARPGPGLDRRAGPE